MLQWNDDLTKILPSQHQQQALCSPDLSYPSFSLHCHYYLYPWGHKLQFLTCNSHNFRQKPITFVGLQQIKPFHVLILWVSNVTPLCTGQGCLDDEWHLEGRNQITVDCLRYIFQQCDLRLMSKLATPPQQTGHQVGCRKIHIYYNTRWISVNVYWAEPLPEPAETQRGDALQDV